jgi:hypothetical protein
LKISAENFSRKCKAENKICLTVKSHATQSLSFWLNPETRILQNFKNSGVIFSFSKKEGSSGS